MDKVRIYCNTCRNDTWHTVESIVEKDFEDTFFGCSQKVYGEILACCGCDDITFRLTRHPFDYEKKGKIDQKLFPQREFEKRQISSYTKMPRVISNLYRETVTAFNSKLYVLVTMGLRTLIEAVVKNKVPHERYANNIESKIDSLRAFFKPAVIETLHEFRKIGNAAAHEGRPEEERILSRAINVFEAVMHYFYKLDEEIESYNRVKAWIAADTK